MSTTPVVLIGLDRDGSLAVDESAEAANKAVQSMEMPSALYSVVTPLMNSYSTLRDVLRRKP